jgi:hypothetical protein
MLPRVKVYVISIDDGYEAIYYRDLIISEGNPLNEGTERILWFRDFMEDNSLGTLHDIVFGYAPNVEEFPDRLSEIKDIQWLG